ncbi:uncharacterized protein LY79DRAFT_573589 [Colletotrichum navitas]|uniref:Uncharacterized protein n=1 Tax=Colletotrichum navitas TaxID=681940 RepID=A0AAD8PJ23_9PEZI|nr:uncharacterized protein LY79DRAFT_573589 [Colletotrichum navitas]KAK1564142.1 hypothetical protein LY79DRAFT_573589 [Colletotrichum navitas]
MQIDARRKAAPVDLEVRTPDISGKANKAGEGKRCKQVKVPCLLDRGLAGLVFLASATPAPLKQHRPAALPTHHCMTCIPWGYTFIFIFYTSLSFLLFFPSSARALPCSVRTNRPLRCIWLGGGGCYKQDRVQGICTRLFPWMVDNNM